MGSHRNLIDALYAALADEDTSKLDALLTDDCELVDPMGTHVGREAIKEVSAEFNQLLSDRRFTIDRCWDAGEAVVCEVSFSATAAGGSAVRLRMCDVFTFRDGRIATNHTYFDPTELLAAVPG